MLCLDYDKARDPDALGRKELGFPGDEDEGSGDGLLFTGGSDGLILVWDLRQIVCRIESQQSEHPINAGKEFTKERLEVHTDTGNVKGLKTDKQRIVSV